MKFILNLVVLIVFGLLQSCVNIKSEAPEINIYKLKQEPIQNTEVANTIKSFIIDKSIWVKKFTVSSELMSEKIIVDNGDITTKLNYQQWINPLDEMLTDFTINRLNRYKNFKKGVFDFCSVSPDLILECRVVNFRINNSTDKNVPRTVEITISANVLSSNENSPGFEQLCLRFIVKLLPELQLRSTSAVLA